MDPPHDRTRLLRQEVGLLREVESRRVFNVAIAVGELAHARNALVLHTTDAPAMDVGLRIDVVSSLVRQSPSEGTVAWVTRPGAPHLHDVDLEWLAAANVAFGSYGRELSGFYAITRSGWLDVRTGQNRLWKRLRL